MGARGRSERREAVHDGGLWANKGASPLTALAMGARAAMVPLGAYKSINNIADRFQGSKGRPMGVHGRRL
jgi:hypothetical protein